MVSLSNASIPGRNCVIPSGRRVRAAVLIVGLALCAPAFANDNSLTLAQAQRLAVLRSRQLPAQDAAIAAAGDMAIAAGQLPDPILKAGIDNLPLSGPDRFSLGNDFMTMRRIGVMQELTGSGKRQLRAERFEREAEKGRVTKTAALAAIERDTALAWLDRYYVEKMAAVLADQAAQASLEIEAAAGAYRAGRGSQADVLAARSALAMVMDRSSELQRRVRNARTMLARWTGQALDAPLAGQPAIDAIHLDPATLDTQLSHHPEIAVMNRQQDIAQVEAKLAQANRKADWTVEVAFQNRGPAYANMLSVGISLPLQWDRNKRQDRELAAKLGLVEQAKAERDEQLRGHVAETRIMIAEWENGRERHARYERELIPLAAERTAATLAAYRGGKANLSEVLASRRAEIEVRLQALQLQMDTARLWAQLDFLSPRTAILAEPVPHVHLDAK
ncbi:MAG: TolC family protein [Bdellovibrionales bacterium]|nr:TolC family protein [Massilia sp.]